MSFDLLLSDGDIWFDEFGKLMIVEEAPKLAQQSAKILYESQGDCLEDFNYGTILRGMIGSYGDGAVLENKARQSIENALDTLQSYQQTQIAEGQFLSGEEYLDSYGNIEIVTPDGDPRNMIVTGELYNREGETIPLAVSI